MPHFNVRMEPVNSNFRIALVAEMAELIWKEHVGNVFSEEQIEYIIENVESEKAIRESLDSDELFYYLILWDEIPVGYSAIKVESEKYHLKRLFIMEGFRDQQIASNAFEFIQRLAGLDGKRFIWTTFSKKSPKTLKMYLHWGFQVKGETVEDLGGVSCDVLVLEKPIPAGY